MTNEISKELKYFRDNNRLASRGGVVLFGSTFAANFPFYELAQRSALDVPLHNRSIAGLTLLTAKEALKDCVYDLQPRKIFLNLGDEDLTNPNAMILYADIVSAIRETLGKREIYVVSVCNESDATQKFNAETAKFCKQNKLTFIDVEKCLKLGGIETPKEIFASLKNFFRNGKIGFTEAFASR